MGLENTKSLVLGGGCFWCVEAVMQRLEGIYEVTPGYSGGKVPGHPTYREICSGLTGHAEVIKISYNPNIISYETLLSVFFSTHDPTTLNRQGADIGTQYRSVIFYTQTEEKQKAQQEINKIAHYFSAPIVTSLEPLIQFFEAEKEHQNYYNQHSSQGYCQVVIDPKIAKLKALYAPLLKETKQQ